MEGRRIVFNTGFVLSLLDFGCLVIAFVTSWWVQSWPRIYSGFKHIGMWEVCFAGYVIERDPTQKAYHGCWWILASEFWSIRSYIMPWWFVITQLVVTLSIVFEGIAVIMLIIIWWRTGSYRSKSVGKRRAPLMLTQWATGIMLIEALVKSATVILFGVAVYIDYFWMPRKDLNYLSWSYGIFVVSTALTIFACMAHVVYTRILRQECLVAPTPVAAAFLSPIRDSRI